MSRFKKVVVDMRVDVPLLRKQRDHLLALAIDVKEQEGLLDGAVGVLDFILDACEEEEQE